MTLTAKDIHAMATACGIPHVYVAVTFRTEGQIFALRPISVGGFVRPIGGAA